MIYHLMMKTTAIPIQKANDEILSIIVKGVEDIVDDAKKLNQFIQQNLIKHKLNVRNIKITRNKNLKVYFVDPVSLEEVFENGAHFLIYLEIKPALLRIIYLFIYLFIYSIFKFILNYSHSFTRRTDSPHSHMDSKKSNLK